MSILFIAAIWSTLLFFSGANNVFTLPSGRQIELASILQTYSDYEKSSLPTRLYEFTSSRLLVGRNLTVNIGSDIFSTVSFSKPKHTKIEIDGRARDNLTISGLLHMGSRFSYATLDDGTLISVHVPGLRLTPADQQLYPGIFIHHGAMPSARLHTKIMLGNDNLKVSTTSDHSHRAVASNSDPGNTLRQSSSCANTSPSREVELAIDFDSTYCKQNGRNAARATAAIMALMELVQQPYSESTCIKFKLVRIRGYCAKARDPYRNALATYQSNTIVDTVKARWISKESKTARDIAHLISGYQQNPNAGKGIAYVGVVCDNNNGYGWSEPAKEIVAHELGHNFGAEHTESGIMVAVQDGSQEFKFSTKSINQIVSYVDGLSESCLSTGGNDTPDDTDDNDDKPRSSPTSSPRAESPPNPRPGSSCASAFSTDTDSLAPKCRKFKARNRSAKIRISQQFGRLDVVVKLSGKPTEIGGTISMSANFDTSSISRTRYSNSARKFSASLDNLPIPPSSTTCCDAPIFLHVSAVVVRSKQTSEISFTQAFRLACFNPCKGRKRRAVAQPSSRRRCAKCVRA